MMPPLTGLGIGRIVIFYIYAAPTALLAEILRLRNVQTPEPWVKTHGYCQWSLRDLGRRGRAAWAEPEVARGPG